MTFALRLSTANPPPAPRGVRWIDLKTATHRLDRPERTVRNWCESKWAPVGLAEQRTPQAGGKAIWFIREDADPQLGRAVFPEAIPFDATILTEAQRRELSRRKLILDRFDRFVSGEVAKGKTRASATETFVQVLRVEGSAESGRTLIRWNANYRLTGLAGLIDERWTIAAKRRAQSNDPFFDHVVNVYRDPRKFSVMVAFQLAESQAKLCGWQLRSYRQCQRFIKANSHLWRVSRGGESAAETDFDPFQDRDYERTTDEDGVVREFRSNDVWVGDAHIFDVFIEHRGKMIRPWLTAWMDARSRKIVGWTITAKDSTQDDVLESFRSGVMAHGVPGKVYVDNGRSYDTFALNGKSKHDRLRGRFDAAVINTEGIFAQLNVKVRHCQKYHGQSKPIERFFGTLEDRFGRSWSTYCGRDPQHKPDGLDENLKAGKAPSMDAFCAAFGTWLEQDYHSRGHLGHGMNGQSPCQVFEACKHSIRTATAEQLDMYLLKPTKPLRVGQNGVRYNGLSYGRNDAALCKIIGESVTLRVDPRNIKSVSVWSADGRFITLANANERLPFNASSDMVRAALAEKKRLMRTERSYLENRGRRLDSIADQITRAAAEQNREAGTDKPDPTLPPPSIRPLRTGLDDQFPHLARAIQRKVAVGAESTDIGDGFLSLNEWAKSQRAQAARAEEDAFSGLMDVSTYRPFRDREDAAEGSSDER